MGVPRPLLLLLLGVMLLSVTFVASRNAREAAEDPGAAPSAPAPQKAESPQGTPQGPAEESALKPSGGAPSRAKGSGPESSSANAGAQARDAAGATAGPPKAMVRALKQRRIVVLFLTQPRQSGDDVATAQAVAGLRGRRGVAVFRDTVAGLDRYGSLVGDLGVSQAPAIVLIDHSRQARVIEGFIDQGSLAQAVADLR